MSTLLRLHLMLPTLYLLQMVSLCNPTRGPVSPHARDTLLSDLE